VSDAHGLLEGVLLEVLPFLRTEHLHAEMSLADDFFDDLVQL